MQPVLEDRIITGERRANDSQLRIRSWNYTPGDDSLVQRWEQTISSELVGIGFGEQLGYLSSTGGAERTTLLELLGIQMDMEGQITGSDWLTETALIELRNSENMLAGSFQGRWNNDQIQVDGWGADEILALEQSGLLGSAKAGQWIPLAQGETVRFIRISESEVGVFDPNAANFYTFLYSTKSGEIATLWPAISKKGQVFRVNNSENTLEGYYLSGAMLNYFPLPAPDSIRWAGSPLLADLNGDGEQNLLVVGQNPYATMLYGYTLEAKPLKGFPLLVGAGGFSWDDSGVNQGSKIHKPGIVGSFVTAIAPSGELSIWEFPNMGTADWPSRMGPWGWNRANQIGEELNLPGGGDQQGVLIGSETYNWPNPARDRTMLRFQTSGAGQVQIQIIDLGGQMIYEQQVQSKGGSPEEIEIDTSKWPSGAYIALVKVTVADKTGSKLVKMAVIK